jgi:hypothetical protein
LLNPSAQKYLLFLLPVLTFGLPVQSSALLPRMSATPSRTCTQPAVRATGLQLCCRSRAGQSTLAGCRWPVVAAGAYGMPLVPGPWISCGRTASRPPKAVVVEAVHPWNWMLLRPSRLRQSVVRTAVWRPTPSIPLHLRQSVIRTAVWWRGIGPTCRSLQAPKTLPPIQIWFLPDLSERPNIFRIK